MVDSQEKLTELLAQEREARAAAERASHLKDEFLATLGHELRTPLNAILGWARLLELGRLKPQDAQRGTETIVRNVRTLARMVNDLVDLTAMANGKIQIDPEETDLCEVIAAVVEVVHPDAAANGVVIGSHVPRSACLVFGDPQRLQQIFWNLLSNSLKFTPRGGRIDVTLTCTGRVSEITITDTGTGIASETLPFVFDHFRHSEGVAVQHAGLGLGLAIVKQLVELHGGSVRASSPGAGLGTSFVVALPRLAPVEAQSGEPEQQAAANTADAAVSDAHGDLDLLGLRILVVDDEPDTLDSLTRVLGGHRAQVAAAPTVEHALATLTSFAPHVLVSDLRMRGRDGNELIRAVRLSVSPEQLPAAALTAFSQPDDARLARDAGFQIHLSKPVEPDELVRVVAELAGRSYAE